MTEHPLILGATGQVYVTLRAALEYHAARGRGDRETGLEEARRELTELLLDARRAPGQDRPPYESWRRRSPPISALVSREGPLAVIVTVNVRSRS